VGLKNKIYHFPFTISHFSFVILGNTLGQIPGEGVWDIMAENEKCKMRNEK